MARKPKTPYLMGDQDLVKAALALHRAQENASGGEQGADGVPCFLFCLLSVSDDTRYKMATDPNWMMEANSHDPLWEEAQEAWGSWAENDLGDWAARELTRLGDNWLVWIEPIRQLIAKEKTAG